MPGLIRIVLHDGLELLLTVTATPATLKKARTSMNNDIDLLGQDVEQDIESLPEGNALGSWGSAASASSASCPASSASSFTSAFSYG